MSEAVVFIPLTRGKFAVIDFSDFDDRMSGHKWCAQKSGDSFYACRSRKESDGPGPQTILLHRVITDCPDGLEPDHKNGDGLDNRKNNLRVGTHGANCRGFVKKRLGASSKFRGVSRQKKVSTWQAFVRVNNRALFLGCFKSEEEAARAYDKKAIELGFAQEALNFPNT